MYDEYLMKLYGIPRLSRPTGRQVGQVWSALCKDVKVSSTDLAAIKRLKLSVLEFLSCDRDGGAIMPDLDKVVRFECSPLASVKKLVQLWYGYATTDQTLRDALVPEVQEFMSNHEFTESEAREASATPYRLPTNQGSPLPVQGAEPRALFPEVQPVAMQPTRPALMPELDDDEPFDEQIGAQLDQLAMQVHQARVKNCPEGIMVTQPMLKKKLQKEIQVRAARIFDHLPQDTRIVIPEGVLVSCERWPEVEPNRLYDALVKRYHSSLRGSKDNERVLSELQSLCQKELPMLIRIVLDSQNTSSFPHNCRSVDEMMKEMERKRIFVLKGKDYAQRFASYVASFDVAAPMWCRASNLICAGFQMPSLYSVTGNQGSETDTA
jgi:hypothetical protein